MLSATEIAAMRETVDDSLPDTASIRRNTPVSDGQGGQTDAWAQVAEVAARVGLTGRRSPEEREIAGRVAGTVLYTLWMPAGTDLTAKDRIVVGARTFEVVGVIQRSEELARQAVCLEMT